MSRESDQPDRMSQELEKFEGHFKTIEANDRAQRHEITRLKNALEYAERHKNTLWKMDKALHVAVEALEVYSKRNFKEAVEAIQQIDDMLMRGKDAKSSGKSG